MAKLITNTNTALMGTGMNVLAKLVPVAEIKIIPELSEIFQRQDKVVEDIKKSMQEDGFHKEEPIVIAKLPDGTILGIADGNTRLMVAKEIGMDEVPVVYKTFDSLEDAIQYAKDRQFHRRNLTQAEIYNSSRYFWRIVIILVLIALIMPHLPEVLNSLKSFINFVTLKFSQLVNIIKIK